MEALIALGGELTMGGSDRPVVGIKFSDVFTTWARRDVDQSAPAALPSRVTVLMDDGERVINTTENAGDDFHISCREWPVVWLCDIGAVKGGVCFCNQFTLSYESFTGAEGRGAPISLSAQNVI